MSKRKPTATTKQRAALVLERIRQYVLESDDAPTEVSDADVIAGELEGMLTELAGQDFFGTEGQNDPRGDFRNGEWSMDRVEGLDK